MVMASRFACFSCKKITTHITVRFFQASVTRNNQSIFSFFRWMIPQWVGWRLLVLKLRSALTQCPKGTQKLIPNEASECPLPVVGKATRANQDEEDHWSARVRLRKRSVRWVDVLVKTRNRQPVG